MGRQQGRQAGLCALWLAVAAASAASLGLQTCSPGAAAQTWEYTDMAMIQHVPTGLAVQATGSSDRPTGVKLTDTPELTSAQWMFNTTDKTLRAFRGTGGCLYATGCGGPLAIGTCRAGDHRQRFERFFPNFDPLTRRHSLFQFGCDQAATRCLAVEDGPAAGPACGLANPYLGPDFNSSVMRPRFEFSSLAGLVLNWTDPDYGYEWWQVAVCGNLEQPAPCCQPETECSCANRFSPLPASAVSGEIEQSGQCSTNAVWDGSGNFSFRVFMTGCGVSIKFNNGGVDPTYRLKISTEYLLMCDPNATKPVIADVAQPTKCNYQVTIQTQEACPYWQPKPAGMPVGYPGCPPFGPH